ncbi:MAG TPA: hypothetical protein VF853_10885 [Candidatus Deferrimicrobiaceae bacterium]
MKGWKAVAGVVLVFFLGVLAGGIGVYRYHRHRMDRFLRGEPGAVSGFLVQRLSRELDLDATQRARVADIVRRTHEEMQALRQQLHPQLEEIVEKGRREIHAELRPDQQARFDEIVAERHRRRGKWHGGARGTGP